MTPPQLPEPEDLSMVVTVAMNGERTVWQRDDEAALDEGLPGERWYDADDADAMGWDQVLKYAETVHLVDPEPMRAAPDPSLPRHGDVWADRDGQEYRNVSDWHADYPWYGPMGRYSDRRVREYGPLTLVERDGKRIGGSTEAGRGE